MCHLTVHVYQEFGNTLLRISHEVSVNILARDAVIKGFPGTGRFTSKMICWHETCCWQKALILLRSLLECPQNMVPGFPQSDQAKEKNREEVALSSMTWA